MDDERILRVAVTRERKLREAALNAGAMTINADQEALNMWQGKQITTEEYTKITGKHPVETLKAMYSNVIYSNAIRMKDRVESGCITPEEYESITKMPYSFDLDGAVDIAIEALRTIKPVVEVAPRDPEVGGNEGETPEH